tara:strand:+ start:7454 stop:7738 length:285 start_codon:yes stop_codon:yes gene_type:complete
MSIDAILQKHATTQSLTDRFLTEPQTYIKGSKAIAEYLGMSQPTLLKLIHAGDLPAFLVANRLQISKSLLDVWLLYRQLEAMNAALGEPARPMP